MSLHGDYLHPNAYKRKRPTITLPEGITLLVDNGSDRPVCRVTFKNERTFMLDGVDAGYGGYYDRGGEYDHSLVLSDVKTGILYIWDAPDMSLPPR